MKADRGGRNETTDQSNLKKAPGGGTEADLARDNSLEKDLSRSGGTETGIGRIFRKKTDPSKASWKAGETEVPQMKAGRSITGEERADTGLGHFLYHLHFEPDRVKPQNWEADWDDAPLPYKLYRGLPTIPLSSEVPLTLEERGQTVEPDLRNIGHFLWYAYGLSRCCQSVYTTTPLQPAMGIAPSYRRFVPSGGGLYPSELYVYLKVNGAAEGAYHYDAAHHRLVLLREGNYDAYLSRALGRRCDVSSCFGTVFVSVMFWKNFFKYHLFSYRLQGLDAGALIGQLLETAKRFGFEAGVDFHFLDRAVNHLLGLCGQEESVYAIVPLTIEPGKERTQDAGAENGNGSVVRASDLCRELPEIRPGFYVRSRNISVDPLLIRMNEACLMESWPQSLTIGDRETNGMKMGRFKAEEKTEKNEVKHAGKNEVKKAENDAVIGTEQKFALPAVNRLNIDLAEVSRKRYSPETEFTLEKVSLEQLAILLREAASFSLGDRSAQICRKGAEEAPKPFEDPDCRGDMGDAHRLSLYVCLHNVDGIPDGAYRYDSTHHTLSLIGMGDHRSRLQQGMTLHNVNLFQVPLCVHVAGELHHLSGKYGFREYRIQQMKAGIVVQRLLLAAAAIGMGGRPLLGFDSTLCDDIYRLKPQGQTCLIQIPVGPCRPSPRLEGSLHG